MQRRTFARWLSPSPKPGVFDLFSTLRDFALITYTTDPEGLAALLPRRLAPLTIRCDGGEKALVSVVAFVNARFRPARLSRPSLNIAQVNYRAYVIDADTGEHAIWFLHSLFGSWLYLGPRLLWQMPWSRARIRMHCRREGPIVPGAGSGLTEDRSVPGIGSGRRKGSRVPDAGNGLREERNVPGIGSGRREGLSGAGDGHGGRGQREPVIWSGPREKGGTEGGPSEAGAWRAAGWDEGPYVTYRVVAESDVAPTELELTQDAEDWGRPVELPGFPDTETGLVCLGHAFNGYYRRRDGRVGLSRVWHGKIALRPARLVKGTFPLLERLGFVPAAQQGRPYSVLVAPAVDFLTRMPPVVVS